MTEYSIPLNIRAGLVIHLEPEDIPANPADLRELMDEAIDAFNSTWADGPLLSMNGRGAIYADILGVENDDWRGETYDKASGDSGDFDLRTDAERSKKLPFTVILRHPDYIGDDGSDHAGTFQAHVMADYPEEAFGIAQDAAIAALYSPEDAELPDPTDPTDWAVVAVFAGHLQDLFIP